MIEILKNINTLTFAFGIASLLILNYKSFMPESYMIKANQIVFPIFNGINRYLYQVIVNLSHNYIDELKKLLDKHLFWVFMSIVLLICTLQMFSIPFEISAGIEKYKNYLHYLNSISNTQQLSEYQFHNSLFLFIYSISALVILIWHSIKPILLTITYIIALLMFFIPKIFFFWVVKCRQGPIFGIGLFLGAIALWLGTL